MLDLRRVRVFCEVAEHRSFSAAAAALGYTQPAVSHHVARLEQEIGQRLINRAARPLTLTQAGELLYRASAAALAEFDRVEVDLQALASGAVGRVTLGSVTTGSRTVVPDASVVFRSRFPGIELVLGEALTSGAILGDVRSGKLDVGIVVVGDGAELPAPALFASRLLLEQPMLVLVPAKHRLAGAGQIRLTALDGEHFLLPSALRHPDLRAEIDELISRAGVAPGGITEISDDIAGSRLVAAGLGVGLAPGLLTLGTSLSGVAVAPIRPAVNRSLYAITIEGRQSEPVRMLLDVLAEAATAYKQC